MEGKLFGIGIGPGDPELVTVKAVNILKTVDAVFLPDSGVREESIALSITRRFLNDNARLETLSFPMTRDREALKTYWNQAVDRVIEELEQGHRVAFLTLGDPSLYSTFGYLLTEAKKRLPEIPVEIVPGVNSPSACAAAASVPLVLGDERLAIIPAVADKDWLLRTLNEFDTVVMLKVGKRLKPVLKLLGELGLKEHAILVTHAGHPNKEQVVHDFSKLENLEEELGYLSSIIIRK